MRKNVHLPLSIQHPKIMYLKNPMDLLSVLQVAILHVRIKLTLFGVGGVEGVEGDESRQVFKTFKIIFIHTKY